MDVPIQKVLNRALKLHLKGQLCPAELWHIIADRLELEDVEESLVSLPLEIKVLLEETYRIAPMSLNPSLTPTQIRQRIKAWLEEKQ